jgi:hypothetical protein
MNPATHPSFPHDAARPPIPDGPDGAVSLKNPTGTTAGRGVCLYRQAAPDELGRAAALCPPAPVRPGEGQLRCFVAVRPQPVERLVAAAFWKLVPETDGTHTAEIQWAALPALGEQVLAFLEALVANVPVQESEAVTVASAEWLAAGHPAAAVLRAVGFAAAGTRTYYQADAAACRDAHAAAPPLAENTLLVAPQAGHFDSLRSLLCGASLRPSELAHGCHTAGSETPSLFDPRCSGVVLADGRVVAACLANASRGHLSLAALAGPPDACSQLLHHALQARDHLPQPVSLGFHLDERDPPAGLAALLEQLPFQNAGQLVRYERPVSAQKTCA